MSVYVAIALRHGIVEEARVLRNKRSADDAESAWLKDNDIRHDQDREGKAQNGIEFILTKCELEA